MGGAGDAPSLLDPLRFIMPWVFGDGGVGDGSCGIRGSPRVNGAGDPGVSAGEGPTDSDRGQSR